MTVRELAKALAALPEELQDLPVVMPRDYYEGETTEVAHAWESEPSFGHTEIQLLDKSLAGNPHLLF
jgi:hypothetical protein